MLAALRNPKAALRELDRLDCEQDHLRFAKRFFEEREGSEFMVGPHHRVMCAALDRVLRGEITRLIINVPPGYTKSELAVIYLVAHGMAVNPRARFIHASFNGPLALENSNKVRDVLRLPGFQDLWPRKIRVDTDSKGLWRTVEGGGLMAAAAGGPITGFRAGTLEPGFTGALVIDDPLKPDDANSDVEREHINGRWHSTFKSRLALESVPVVVIMQRLHVNDFSGFLLKGGAGCKWHHLLLPVWVDNGAPYPAEYTHGIPLPHGLPDGPLWPTKHDATAIKLLQVDSYTYSGQYAQVPVVAGGNLFREEWLHGYDVHPDLSYRTIYADTAQKAGERHDYSVLQCWGMGKDGRAYLLDQMRGKWESPDLDRMARAFWKLHADLKGSSLGPLRAMKVEDKSSGTGLIQSLKRPPDPIPILPIPRSRDKELRANDVLPTFAAGLVRVPMKAEWFPAWRQELLAFPNGSHDDQVDPTMDAVSDMLVNGSGFDTSYSWV